MYYGVVLYISVFRDTGRQFTNCSKFTYGTLKKKTKEDARFHQVLRLPLFNIQKRMDRYKRDSNVFNWSNENKLLYNILKKISVLLFTKI
jgi:hypothetical protein